MLTRLRETVLIARSSPWGTERLTAIVQVESAETARLKQNLGEFEGMDSDGESGTDQDYSRDHVRFMALGERHLWALAFEGW